MSFLLVRNLFNLVAFRLRRFRTSRNDKKERIDLMAGVLYRKEREVLEFLAQFQNQKGYSPTLSEIAKATGHRSNSTIHALIRALVDKGYVQKVQGNARVLKIIDPNLTATMGTGIHPSIDLPLMGFIAAGR